LFLSCFINNQSSGRSNLLKINTYTLLMDIVLLHNNNNNCTPLS